MKLSKAIAKLRIGGQERFNIRAIQEYLDNLAGGINSILKQPILHGRLITDISVEPSTKAIIKTGLGRAYQGYIVVTSNGNINAIETHNDNPRKETELHITLKGTATKISIWVF